MWQDARFGNNFQCNFFQNLIQPTRKFIREGPIDFAVGNSKLVEGHIFLFNDIIVLAKVATSVLGNYMVVGCHLTNFKDLRKEFYSIKTK
jgi:hypothetical protein